MKSSQFLNSGYEELSYEELFLIAKMNPNHILVKHDSQKFIPRKIPSEYIEEISYFAPKYDNLLFCLCLEVPFIFENNQYFRRLYYNPSNRLLATLEREDEKGIRLLLGENDNLDQNERQKIEEIIYAIQQANLLKTLRDAIKYESHIEKKNKLIENIEQLRSYEYINRKRLSNILMPRKIKKLIYKGNACEGLVPSKYTDEYYKVLYKQFIFFDGEKIKYNPHIQGICTCGFNIQSNVKYEFYNILTSCSHIDLLTQALENPNYAENYYFENSNPIKQIFNPFSPLDNPLLHDEKLRTIIRNGLYNFLIPQKYIKTYYNDSNNYHQKNGFTWFRCELDCFLMSFKEIYNKDLFNIMEKYFNPQLSDLKTSIFFGDFIDSGFMEVNVEHHFNLDKNKLEHLVNDKWKKIYHCVYDKQTKKYIFLQSHEFRHNKSFDHEFADPSIDQQRFKIVHVIKLRKPITCHSIPFSVSLLPNGIRIFPMPYKNRKEK